MVSLTVTLRTWAEAGAQKSEANKKRIIAEEKTGGRCVKFFFCLSRKILFFFMLAGTGRPDVLQNIESKQLTRKIFRNKELVSIFEVDGAA